MDRSERSTAHLSRRVLLRTSALGALGLTGAALVGCTDDDDAAAELRRLREAVRALSLNTASGGGVNRKHMPHPQSGEPVVPMAEVFSFDRHHAFCRVDTNPEAFRMPTFAMGEVVIEPHQFFMAMDVTSVEQFSVTTNADGTRTCVMRGGIACATEVGQAETTIGGRDAIEHASYRVEAVDAGVGGGAAGDRFEFTVFFDENEAPINHAIFGPEFTFTGEMVSGEITIVDPQAL